MVHTMYERTALRSIYTVFTNFETSIRYDHIHDPAVFKVTETNCNENTYFH